MPTSYRDQLVPAHPERRPITKHHAMLIQKALKILQRSTNAEDSHGARAHVA